MSTTNTPPDLDLLVNYQAVIHVPGCENQSNYKKLGVAKASSTMSPAEIHEAVVGTVETAIAKEESIISLDFQILTRDDCARPEQ